MTKEELNELIEEGQHWRIYPDTVNHCGLIGKLTDAVVLLRKQRDYAETDLKSALRKLEEVQGDLENAETFTRHALGEG